MSDEEITKVLRKAWKIGIIQSVNNNNNNKITKKLSASELQLGEKYILLSKIFNPEITGNYVGKLTKKEQNPKRGVFKLTFQIKESGDVKSHHLSVDSMTKTFLTIPEFHSIKELIDTSDIQEDDNPDNINSQRRRDFEEKLRRIKEKLENARKDADQQADIERQQNEQRIRVDKERAIKEKARKEAEQKAEMERLQREQEQREQSEKERQKREEEDKQTRLKIQEEEEKRIQEQNQQRRQEEERQQRRQEEERQEEERQEEERQRLKLQNQQNQKKLQQKTSPYSPVSPSYLPVRETRKRGTYIPSFNNRCKRNTMTRYCIPKRGCVRMVEKTWTDPCPKGYRRCADGVCYSMADGSAYAT